MTTTNHITDALQVPVLSEGQVVPIWVRGQTLVRLRVTSCNPSGPAVRLVAGCEVHVAPKPRQRSQAPNKQNSDEEKDGQEGGNHALNLWQSVSLRALQMGPAYMVPMHIPTDSKDTLESSKAMEPSLIEGLGGCTHNTSVALSSSWLTTVAIVAPGTRVRPTFGGSRKHSSQSKAEAANVTILSGMLLLIRSPPTETRDSKGGGDGRPGGALLTRAAVRAVVSAACPRGHVMLSPPLMQALGILPHTQTVVWAARCGQLKKAEGSLPSVTGPNSEIDVDLATGEQQRCNRSISSALPAVAELVDQVPATTLHPIIMSQNSASKDRGGARADVNERFVPGTGASGGAADPTTAPPITVLTWMREQVQGYSRLVRIGSPSCSAAPSVSCASSSREPTPLEAAEWLPLLSGTLMHLRASMSSPEGSPVVSDSLHLLRFSSQTASRSAGGKWSGPNKLPRRVPIINLAAGSPLRDKPRAGKGTSPGAPPPPSATKGGPLTANEPILISQCPPVSDVMTKNNIGACGDSPSWRSAVADVAWLRPQLESCLKRLVPLLRGDGGSMEDVSAVYESSPGPSLTGADVREAQGPAARHPHPHDPTRVPRSGGLLLTGPSGSGKTAVLTAIQALMTRQGSGGHGEEEGMGDAPVPCLHVSCSKLAAASVAGGGSNKVDAGKVLSDIVIEALRCHPSLIVLDDIELLMPSGGSDGDGGMGGEQAAASTALAEWLAEVMDTLRGIAEQTATAPRSKQTWEPLHTARSPEEVSGLPNGSASRGSPRKPLLPLCMTGPTGERPVLVAWAASARDAAAVHPALRAAGLLDAEVRLPPPGGEARVSMLSAGLSARGCQMVALHQQPHVVTSDNDGPPDAPMGQGRALSLSLVREALLRVAAQAEGCDARDLGTVLDRAVHIAVRRKLQSPSRRDSLLEDRSIIEVLESDLIESLRDFVPAAFWTMSGGRGGTGGQGEGSGGGVEGWQDIGGLLEARDALREALELPFRYAALVSAAPLRLRTGLLLYGPPGCGKTHIVSAAAAAMAKGVSMRYVKVPSLSTPFGTTKSPTANHTPQHFYC